MKRTWIILATVAALTVGIVLSPQSGTSAAQSKSTEDSLWIWRSDKSLQCEDGSAEALDKGKTELQKAGIEVLDAQKGSDGLFHAQMCGAETGALNRYRIRKADLVKARSRGFKLETAAGSSSLKKSSP